MARCALIPVIFPPAAPRARRAFSLVELLVVVAIIALLIAILVPTLSSARAAARLSATQALLADISRAGESFALDNRRAPGMIPDSVLFGSAPLEGFTAMDNALLELAGGGMRVVAGNTSILNTVDDEVQLLTDPDTNTEYYASPTLIGEGNYLQLDGANLDVMNNADSELRRIVPDPYEATILPTLVDNFRTPILFFRQSGARFSDPRTSNFELVGYEIASGYEGNTWYWWDAAHAEGFAGAPSQDPDSFGNPDTNGSWLYFSGSPGSDTLSAYSAVLEHPTLYENTPRGKFVVISAGTDAIYFSRSQYAATEDWKGQFELYYSDGDVEEAPDVATTFDDVIVSGGG